MLYITAPKLEKKILPSLASEQIAYLIEQVALIRDKTIISLFTDSGLRLKELASTRIENIDWE